MGHRVVFAGKNLHLENAELCVDRVDLVHDRQDFLVFLIVHIRKTPIK